MASKEANERLPPLPHPEASPPPTGAPTPATLWYPSYPQTLQWGQSRGAGRHPTTRRCSDSGPGTWRPCQGAMGRPAGQSQRCSSRLPLGDGRGEIMGEQEVGPPREEHASTPAGFPSQSQGRTWAPLGKPCPTGGFCPEPHNAINIPAPVAGMSALL